MSLPQAEEHQRNMVYTSHRSALFPPACLAAATTTATFYKPQPPFFEDSFPLTQMRSTVHPAERTENAISTEQAGTHQQPASPLSNEGTTPPTKEDVLPHFSQESRDTAIQKTTIERSPATEVSFDQPTVARKTSFSSYSSIDRSAQTLASSELTLSTVVSPSCQITGTPTTNIQQRCDKSPMSEPLHYPFCFSSPSAAGSFSSPEVSSSVALQGTPTFPFLHEDTSPDLPTDASPILSPKETTKILEAKGSVDSMAATAAGPGRLSGTLSLSSSGSMSDVTFDERSLAKCSSSGSNSFFQCNDSSGTKEPTTRTSVALQSAIRKACSLAKLLSEKRTQGTPAQAPANANGPQHNSPPARIHSYSPVEAAASFECDVPPPLTPVTSHRPSFDSQDLSRITFADIISEGQAPGFIQTDSYPLPKNKTVVAHIGVPFLKGNETLCVPLEKGLQLQQFYQSHSHVISDKCDKIDSSSGCLGDTSLSVRDAVLLKDTRTSANSEKKMDGADEDFSKETLTLSQSGSSESLVSVYSSKSQPSSSSSFSFSYPESQTTGRLQRRDHTSTRAMPSGVQATQNSPKSLRYDRPSPAHRRSNALGRFAAPTVASGLKSVSPKKAFFYTNGEWRTVDHEESVRSTELEGCPTLPVSHQPRHAISPVALSLEASILREKARQIADRVLNSEVAAKQPAGSPSSATPPCGQREQDLTTEVAQTAINQYLLRVSAALRKQTQTAKCLGQRRGTCEGGKQIQSFLHSQRPKRPHSTSTLSHSKYALPAPTSSRVLALSKLMSFIQQRERGLMDKTHYPAEALALLATSSAVTNEITEQPRRSTKKHSTAEENHSDFQDRDSQAASHLLCTDILQQRGTPRPAGSRRPVPQSKRITSFPPEATPPASSMRKTVERSVACLSQAVQTEKTFETVAIDAPVSSADALCKQRPTVSRIRPLGRPTSETPVATTQQRAGRLHGKRSLSQPQQPRVPSAERFSKSPAQVRSTSLSNSQDSVLKPTVASAARCRHVLLSRNCAPQALDYLNNLSWSIHQKSSPERLWVTHLRNPKPLAPPLSTVPLPITTITTRQAAQTAQIKTQKKHERLLQDEEVKHGPIHGKNSNTQKTTVNEPSNTGATNNISGNHGSPTGGPANNKVAVGDGAPNNNMPTFNSGASSCETFSGGSPSGNISSTAAESGELFNTESPSDEILRAGTINSELLNAYVINTYAPNGSASQCSGVPSNSTKSTTLSCVPSGGSPVTNWPLIGSPTVKTPSFDNCHSFQNTSASPALIPGNHSVPYGGFSLTRVSPNGLPVLHNAQATRFGPSVAPQSQYLSTFQTSPLVESPHFSNSSSKPTLPLTLMQNASNEGQFSTPSPTLPHTASMPIVSSAVTSDWTHHSAVQTLKNHVIPSNGSTQDAYGPPHPTHSSAQALSTSLSLAPLHHSFVIPGTTMSIYSASGTRTSAGYTEQNQQESSQLSSEASTIPDIRGFKPHTTITTTNPTCYNGPMTDPADLKPPSRCAQNLPRRQNTNIFNTTETQADHRWHQIVYNAPSLRADYKVLENKRCEGFSSSPSLTGSVCFSTVHPEKTTQERRRHPTKSMSFSTLLESAVRPETQRAIVSSRVPPAPYGDILAPRAPRPKLSAKERYSTMVTRSNKKEALTGFKEVSATATLSVDKPHNKNSQVSPSTAWIGPWPVTTYGYPSSCQNSYTMRTDTPGLASSASATSYPMSGPPYGASYNAYGPVPSHVFLGRTNNATLLSGSGCVETNSHRTPPALESSAWIPSAYSSSSAPSPYGLNTPFPPAHFRPPTGQLSLQSWPQTSILSGVPAWQSPLSFQDTPYRKSWNAQPST